MIMEEKKFRLAIVGGGICGLTFAIALSRSASDIEVNIYEAATTFTEVGAGMGMWPRIWEVMDDLGLSESLRNRTGSQSQAGKLQYRKSDQAEGIPFVSSHVKLETYHRAEFLQTLLEHAPPNYHTHFSKRLVLYSDFPDGESKQEPVTLHFADGTSEICDVLIGADGIKSTVRSVMYKELAALAESQGAQIEEVERLNKSRQAAWTGQKCWRALIPREDLRNMDPFHPSLAACPMVYTGKHRYMITYPICHGQMLNVAAFVSEPEMRGTIYDKPWQCPGSQAELMAHFEEFETPVQTVLRLMITPAVWAVNTVEALPTYVSRRVALIGDAAHAMVPHQASGAGQGVEDGMILACLLASSLTTRSSISTALRVYDTVRRPFAQHIQQLSFETGRMNFYETLELDGKRGETEPMMYAETLGRKRQSGETVGKISDPKLETLAKDLEDVFRWTWEGHVVEQQESAMALLGEESCA